MLDSTATTAEYPTAGTGKIGDDVRRQQEVEQNSKVIREALSGIRHNTLFESNNTLCDVIEYCLNQMMDL